MIWNCDFDGFFDKFRVLVPKSFSLRARTMCLLCVSTTDHYYVHTKYGVCATTWHRDMAFLKFAKSEKKLNIEKVGSILFCRNFCRWQKFLRGARFFFCCGAIVGVSKNIWFIYAPTPLCCVIGVFSKKVKRIITRPLVALTLYPCDPFTLKLYVCRVLVTFYP